MRQTIVMRGVMGCERADMQGKLLNIGKETCASRSPLAIAQWNLIRIVYICKVLVKYTVQHMYIRLTQIQLAHPVLRAPFLVEPVLQPRMLVPQRTVHEAVDCSVERLFCHCVRNSPHRCQHLIFDSTHTVFQCGRSAFPALLAVEVADVDVATYTRQRKQHSVHLKQVGA